MRDVIPLLPSILWAQILLEFLYSYSLRRLVSISFKLLPHVRILYNWQILISINNELSFLFARQRGDVDTFKILLKSGMPASKLQI